VSSVASDPHPPKGPQVRGHETNTEDDEPVEALLKACDEMLEYHDRAGTSDGDAARAVRAKRTQLTRREVRPAPTAKPVSDG
jgi:hypothetical protein